MLMCRRGCGCAAEAAEAAVELVAPAPGVQIQAGAELVTRMYRRHKKRSQVQTMAGGDAGAGPSSSGLLGDDGDEAGKSKVRNAATLEGGDD